MIVAIATGDEESPAPVPRFLLVVHYFDSPHSRWRQQSGHSDGPFLPRYVGKWPKCCHRQSPLLRPKIWEYPVVRHIPDESAALVVARPIDAILRQCSRPGPVLDCTPIAGHKEGSGEGDEDRRPVASSWTDEHDRGNDAQDAGLDPGHDAVAHNGVHRRPRSDRGDAARVVVAAWLMDRLHQQHHHMAMLQGVVDSAPPHVRHEQEDILQDVVPFDFYLAQKSP